MRPYTTLFCGFSVIAAAVAQPNDNLYSTDVPIIFSDVTATADGGYTIAGHLVDGDISRSDLFLLHTNGAGEPLWARRYGGPGSDDHPKVVQTPDGGYHVIARTRNFVDTVISDLLIMHTDAAGVPLWSRTWGWTPGTAEWPEDLTLTPDGGLLATGYTVPDNSGVWAIRLDQDGDTLWTRVFSSDPMVFPSRVEAIPGTSDYFILGSRPGVITYLESLRISGTGELVETRSWDMARCYGQALYIDNDQRVVMAGSTDESFFVMGLSPDGAVEWTTLITNYFPSGVGTVMDLVKKPAGGFYLAGLSPSQTNVTPVLIDLKADGTASWASLMGSYDPEMARCLIADNGDPILFSNNGNGECQWRRTSPDGDNACVDPIAGGSSGTPIPLPYTPPDYTVLSGAPFGAVELPNAPLVIRKTTCIEQHVATNDPVPAFRLFPDPADAMVRLELPQAPVQLLVHDARGALVALPVIERHGGSIILDTSRLPNGPYYVSALLPGRAVQQATLIVVH